MCTVSICIVNSSLVVKTLLHVGHINLVGVGLLSGGGGGVGGSGGGMGGGAVMVVPAGSRGFLG